MDSSAPSSFVKPAQDTRRAREGRCRHIPKEPIISAAQTLRSWKFHHDQDNKADRAEATEGPPPGLPAEQ